MTNVIDGNCAARIAGYHLTALALIAAEPDAEHEEMLLKARAVLEAVGGRLAGEPQLTTAHG